MASRFKVADYNQLHTPPVTLLFFQLVEEPVVGFE